MNVKNVIPSDIEKQQLVKLGLSLDFEFDQADSMDVNDMDVGDDDFQSLPFKPSIPKKKKSSAGTSEKSIRQLKGKLRTIDSNQKILLKEFGLLKKDVNSKFQYIMTVLVDLPQKMSTHFGEVDEKKYSNIQVLHFYFFFLILVS